MSTQVALSSAIYPPECLQEAVTAYQGLCSVKVVSETPSVYYVEIRQSSEMVDEKLLTNEFLNYLLDLSLEKHLAEFQQRYGTN